MKALAHPDLVVLEATLGDLVRQAQADDPLARVAVIVPTARLAAHVQRRLAERHGALLGVEVLHHRALVYRILDEAGISPPRLLSPRLLVDLLRAALPASRPGELSRFVAASPGALQSLLGTFTDLREAGLAPAQALSTLSATSRGREIAAIYEAFVARLERAETEGHTDGVGLVLAALPWAAAFAARRRALIHHGAYDLIGVHTDLLNALDAAGDLTVLLPGLPPLPGWPGAERLERPPTGGNGLPDPLPRAGLLADRIGHLHDESWRGDRLPAETFRFAHAQGNTAELQFALHAALARVAAGTPPREVAIVARHLAPWSVPLPAAAASLDLSLESSLTLPAARDPIVHELCLLLRTVADGYPRGATVELLASPRLRWDRLPDSSPAAPDAAVADRVSRDSGLIGGLAEWTEAIGAGPESDAPTAAALARIRSALAALDARVQPRVARSWPAHAASFAALAATLLEPATTAAAADDGARVLDTLLGEMRLLPLLAGDSGPLPFSAAVAWLEESAASTPLPSTGEDCGGIRVLDAMQARGLTFDTLILMGMNDGLFPRPARADPLLPDEMRRALRQATERPVPLKADGEEEERLLLGMLLGAARQRVEVSWQRADDAGRQRAPSLALRAVARLCLGEADLDAAQRVALRVAAHPAQRLEETAAATGLLAPREAALLAALRGGPTALARVRGDLAPGLALLRATESFSSADLSFDGRVAPLPPGATFGVSMLQAAGGCALQAFFRHRLHLHELDEEAEAESIPTRDIGTLVHAALQQLYERLGEERLLGSDRGSLPAAASARLEASRQRAAALLPEIWEALVGLRFSPRARRLPTLWRHALGRWRDATAEFVRHDLARLDERGAVDMACELEAGAEIALPGSEPLRLRGRFDRRSTGPAGAWISDYKTSGSRGNPLKTMMDVTSMLRGLSLQAPLYHLMAGESAAVEFLLVRPAGGRRPGEPEESVAVFDGFPSPDHRDGFLETLRVIADLLRAGRHPMRPEDARCGRCAWRTACRRTHPPTLQREAAAVDAVEYRALVRKNKSTNTHLAGLGAHGPAADGDGEEA